MTLVHRVLPPQPYESLERYLHAGGGRGLDAARQVEPEVVVAEIEAAGLRGRGGGGFPTATKWRAVAANRSEVLPATVVVNAAEGEPGTFKDRAILRANPYEVLEGALIAAYVVGADRIIVALKRDSPDLAHVRAAQSEVEAAGWAQGITLDVAEGPHEYLFGEETGLLEVLDGRAPFPRIAPPYRRGWVEVVESDADVGSGSGSPADVEMAGPTGESVAPPALVGNVETLANVPKIIARGAAWFRTEGTDASPGTIVATVSGSVRSAGVGEVLMGTTVRQAIDEIGGGARAGRRVVAVLGGVSSAVLTEERLDTPLTYEDMAAAGSGLGSASLTVFDDTDDMAAVAAGVAHFLAVESCGQCIPCKRDGLDLANTLARVCRGETDARQFDTVPFLLDHVGEEARCNLAAQQQVVVGSIVAHFGDQLRAHLEPGAEPVEPVLVAGITALVDGRAELDERSRTKQPDWTYDEEWSGQTPVERLLDHREHETLE